MRLRAAVSEGIALLLWQWSISAQNAALPRDREPFPNRVIFAADFDAGERQR